MGGLIGGAGGGGGSGGGGSGNPFAFAGQQTSGSFGGQSAPWGIGDPTAPGVDVGTIYDPTAAANQQAAASPPPPPDTTAPGGQQSGPSSGSDPSWLSSVSNILLGKDSNQLGSTQAQATSTAGGPPTPTQSAGPGWFTKTPDDQGQSQTNLTGTSFFNPRQTQQPPIQFDPSQPGGTPPGWSSQASLTAQTPGTAAGGPNPTDQLPLPRAAINPGEAAAATPSDTVSPQSPQISGKTPTVSTPAAPAAAPATDPNQYTSQGYTSGGYGYGDASAAAGAPDTGATAGAGGMPGMGGAGKGQALGDLFQGNFGRFFQDLFGGGGARAGTPSPQPGASTNAPQPAADTSQPPPARVADTPTGVPNPVAQTPQTQLAGTSTGLPDQIARPGTAPSPTGVATAAAPRQLGPGEAEAATPPGAPTDQGTVGTPGTMTVGQPGAGFAPGATGGPPGDRPTPGNAQASQSYIAQNGGYSLTGFNRTKGGYGGFKMNPEFSNRLAAAGQAYERETGQKPQYGLGDRDPETQRFFWEDSRHGTRYAAAPPGRSLHQQGLAMDMPPGGFDSWLHRNGQRFGLGFPLGNRDPNHIQMQDLRGRAFPYTPQVAEANMHIPGSQAPVGSRAPDPNYNPGDYARATFQIESGGNPSARTGSNRGLGQFGPQEEARYGLNARNRNSPAAQQAALQRETQDNTRILQNSLGRAPTGAELYLTHQQGQAGGPALLRAPADQPAWKTVRPFYRSDAIAQRAIRGNIPSDNPLRGTPVDQVTAGQFRGMWADRYNREVARGQTRQPTATAPATAPGPQASTRAIRLASSSNELSPELARLVEQQNDATPPGMPQFSPRPPSFEEDLRQRAYENWRNPKRLPGGKLLRGMEKGIGPAIRGADWLWHNREELENAARTYYDAP
jgi:hypothetical protein